MLWIRDEFGNLYEAQRICQGAAVFDGSRCIEVNGYGATSPYPQAVCEEILADISLKIREGNPRLLDLSEIIRDVRADMEGPLPMTMHPVPEMETGQETVH